VTGSLLECADNGSPSTQTGDPCDVSTGDFSQTESDVSNAGLSFQRFYHSAMLESSHSLGVGWTHSYAAYLIFTNSNPSGLLRPDGHQDALDSSKTPAGVWITDSGSSIHVQQSGTQWIASLKDGSEEIYSSVGRLLQKVAANGQVTTLSYNANGQLFAVTGPFGHTLQLGYNTGGQITQLVDPNGRLINYAYDGSNNLISATYQDSSIRTYLYENSSFQNNLTGILDENSNRFLTVTYDPTTGGVTSSQQAGGAQAVSITYSANGAVATDSLGATNTFGFTSDSRTSPRVNSFSRNKLLQTFTVQGYSADTQQRVIQSVDANSTTTTYAYDVNHLTSKTEAYGTSSARTTSYQYLSTSTSLPTLITEALLTTSYVYYPGTNNINTKTVTDTTVTPNVSRNWTYTFNGSGQVLTIDGPRTDVSDITTYTYYTCTTGSRCGQVNTIKDAVGNVTTFNTYNAYAQPLTITDPNGVVTTLTYDLRQRIKSRQVGTETTSYVYYPTGQLETVTLPDASTITYTYDAAHRLTDITDGLGNHTHYTLDAMGNRAAENTYDPSSTLKRSHTRVINALNQLYQDINAAGTAAVTTTYTYDSNGNQSSSDAPLSRNKSNLYDPLNRLKQITDPAAGVTKFGYDANDQLTSVIDPRSLTTTYTRNGFGDFAKQVSPDTGTTTNTYDSGGNLKTATDARGALATYSYDALNRVTQVAYSDQSILYTYDVGTNGKGRLTGASDANHSMSWVYDTLRRVTGKSQTVSSVTKSVGYAYASGDLITMTTPSGQVITYGYTDHRITSVKVNATIVLSGVTYDPFGPANAWAWGNTTTVSRTFDSDGNLLHIITEGVTNTYAVDNASRITSISDSGLASNTYTFGYDLLDRVTSGISTAATRGYTYDANSNRLTTTGTSASTELVDSISNRLDSTSGAIARTYSYDTAGNTESYASNLYMFNQRGRMSVATVSGSATNYIYNALGQLIEKSGNGGTTLLMYDEAGHILGEYTNNGSLIQETIWMGDIPVATLVPSGSTVAIYYVHTDHLGTPRKITRPSDNGLMWRWDPDTFGSVAPNGNPSGLGTLTYNLRFPGQYSLNESGLYYNHFRTYDPTTGRYIESDPIGVGGGMNTYGYVLQNPIMLSDSLGLFPCNDWGWMAVDWALGLGIKARHYSVESNQLQDIRQLPPIGMAKQLYQQKNSAELSKGDCCNPSNLQPYTNYAAKFGLPQFAWATALQSCAWHFTGSFSVDVYPVSCKRVQLHVRNVSSFTSFSAGLGPSWNSGPMSNTSQDYNWTEDL
jgi:RHS repeat-associated protein